MIWLCAYTTAGVHGSTLEALEQHVPDGDAVRLINVGDDAYLYGRLLAEQWDYRADLAVVEQDIVIRADVVEAFQNCEHDYCCFPYAWTTCVGPALGCTRFRRRFLERYPEAMLEALQTPSSYGLAGHWKQLDVFLMRRILRDKHGEQPHVHLPAVEHLNPEQALVPGASLEPVLTVEGF